MGDETVTSALRLTAQASLVFIVALLVYALLPTRNYYWDGLIYSEFLEQTSGVGSQLFHPNHLIYNFAGSAAFYVFRTVGIFDRALFALQYLSIFFGAAAVA